MKLKLLAGAAVAAVFAATGASAQPYNGFYGAVDLGYHTPEGIAASSGERGPDGNAYEWTFDSEDTWAGFARLGYRFAPNWRVELEGGYRPGDVEAVIGDGRRFPGGVVGLCAAGVVRTAASPQCLAPSGSIDSWTLLANVIYDIDLPFLAPTIRPFVGAGAGVNRVSVDMIGQFSNVPGTISGANPRFQNLVIDDDDLAIAYQVLAGLAWEATDRLSVDLTYRYLGGSSTDFDSVGSANLQPGTFSGEYRDSSLSLGLRYSFASPPPPPPVVDTPVAREFVVYFPFDQSVLTPEAQTVVQEAASYAQSGNATQIQVVGHADTSGSAAYNVRLSERRARAVADAMVGLGVNPAGITADWRGETQPAVSTGDGVREPLNRRTSINVNF